jgi:hypothetical protein
VAICKDALEVVLKQVAFGVTLVMVRGVLVPRAGLNFGTPLLLTRIAKEALTSPNLFVAVGSLGGVRVKVESPNCRFPIPGGWSVR